MTRGTIYRLAALVVMGSMAVESFCTTHHSPEIDRYQQAIHMAGQTVPSRVGPWVGQDIAVQAQALTVLKPNVMISRRYVNVEDGTVAGLLLVHCGDAHHMVGHFPMRCYPAEGWVVRSHVDKDWQAGDLKLTGTEYTFSRSEAPPGGGTPVEQSLIVVNCLLRPGGLVLRDMDAMSATIIGAGGQASGAGQIQIYFDGGVPKAKRDAAVAELTNGCLPVIRSILEKLPT